MTLIDALILGLVEGITEFLPISSTGHLIVASAALGLDGPLVDSFIDAIQMGAILAVLALYPGRFKGLLNWGGRGFQGWRALSCLALSSAPAVLVALLFEKKIKAVLFAPGPVALAMAAGALWILWAERKSGEGQGLDELRPSQALKIGLWQVLALWPGMSRSACSILGGMHSGLSRKAAVEYSFLAATPLLTAAFLYEMLKHGSELLGMGAPFYLAFATAFASAYAAVRYFVGWVSRSGLQPFAWYRLAAAVLLWIWLA